MKLLTNKQQKSYENAKLCYVWNKKIENKHAKDKKYQKFRDHCHYTGEYRGAAHSICNLKYSVPKEIPIVFHNESNNDYHFIIKVLAEGSEKQFTFLRENAEKYATLPGPIEKEVKQIDKSGKEITRKITYRLQFIDSARFISSSLSNLVNNLIEEIHKKKCKYRHDNKKYETCGVKYKDCKIFFENKNFEDNLIKCKCLCCNKNCQKKSLIKTLRNNLKNFLIHTNFLNMISINLFYCCEKVFTHIIIWMKEKNTMKLHYLKKKVFTVT